MKKKKHAPPKQHLSLEIQMNPKGAPFPFLVTRGDKIVGQLDSLRNAHGLLLWVSFMDLLSTEIQFQTLEKRRA